MKRSPIALCLTGNSVTLCLAAVFLSSGYSSVIAMDRLQVESDDGRVSLQGQLIESGDPDFLLLLSRDNRLQKIPSKNVLKRERLKPPFHFTTRDQVVKSLLSEYGRDYRIHQTAHYVICFNTIPDYARWVGTLLERVHRAYFTYWDKRDAALTVPEQPLVVIVHKNQTSFLKFVEGELGSSSEFVPGYYNQESNRINLYDLSRLTERQESLLAQGRRPGSPAQQIQRVLGHPTAERNVATIVHEGTHQLCFNSGMIRRLSYTPLWLSEGMAIYFETPDLTHSKGWSAIGNVNRYNLNYYRLLMQEGKLIDLKTLLSSDEEFRSGKTVRAAYAQSWALNYFLQKTRPAAYREFVKMQRLTVPLQKVSEQQRLSMFTSAFGGGLSRLEQELREYIRGL